MSTDEGYAPLNLSDYSFGKAVNISDPCLNSAAGHFLGFIGESLRDIEPESGNATEIFKWYDVALSSMGIYGMGGFQNSEGNIFYLENNLIKVHPGHRGVKKTLTLAVFGDSSAADYEHWQDEYSCSKSLKNAIIHFNNTDPEYKIEIKPIVYNGVDEIDKTLMELATGSGIDLIDTGALPDGSMDGTLLIDMLPYLDKESEISREDFIPTLFDAMLINGGLYEYTEKFSMLTMSAPADILPDKDSFTVQNILAQAQANPDLLLPEDWNYLVDFFAWAASAEFCDWKNGSCNFNDPVFTAWLDLLKELPSELVNITRDKPNLFDINYEFQVSAGYFARQRSGGEYIVQGFPETKGTGTYFMKLGSGAGYVGSIDSSKNIATLGQCTRIGIVASGDNHDGAWRFVKTLMLGETAPELMEGIPVMKASFERALDSRLSKAKSGGNDYDAFNQYDADCMRNLVYNSTGIVHKDDALMDIFRTEINAFLGGKGTTEECAERIQSRVSIYMAEQA